jgi:hypothetical protein
VNFTDFGIIVRASQPRQQAENLYVHSKSSGKVPRPNSSESSVSAHFLQKLLQSV